APVAVEVTGPWIAVGIDVAEAVGAGLRPQVAGVEDTVRVAIHGHVLLVRAERHAPALRVEARRLVLPGTDARVVVRPPAAEEHRRIARREKELCTHGLRVGLVVVRPGAVLGPAVVLVGGNREP